MSRSFRQSLIFGVLLVGSGTLLASAGLAQEKCTESFAAADAESEYTEQHVMDVGDVAGHQIRIFELHRTYPDAEPNCEGLKRTEQLVHGFSDYVDRNGRAWGYSVTTYDNGDQMFSEFTGTSHTVTNADGSKTSTYVGTSVITGGTGMYAGVRGTGRDTVRFDPEKNINESDSEVTYWIEQ